MQMNPTDTYKYNRLELVLFTYQDYSIMEFQPYRSKGVYIIGSTSFILYDRNVCESQKMKLIQNIVRKKQGLKSQMMIIMMAFLTLKVFVITQLKTEISYFLIFFILKQGKSISLFLSY